MPNDKEIQYEFLKVTKQIAVVMASASQLIPSINILKKINLSQAGDEEVMKNPIISGLLKGDPERIRKFNELNSAVMQSVLNLVEAMKNIEVQQADWIVTPLPPAGPVKPPTGEDIFKAIINEGKK